MNGKRKIIFGFLTVICSLLASIVRAQSFSVTPARLEFTASPGQTLTENFTAHFTGTVDDAHNSPIVSVENSPVSSWLTADAQSVTVKVPADAKNGTYEGAMMVTAAIQAYRVPIKITIQSNIQPISKVEQVKYLGAWQDSSSHHIWLQFSVRGRNNSTYIPAEMHASLDVYDTVDASLMGNFAAIISPKLIQPSVWEGVAQFEIPSTFGVYRTVLRVRDLHSEIQNNTQELVITVPINIPVQSSITYSSYFFLAFAAGGMGLVGIIYWYVNKKNK